MGAFHYDWLHLLDNYRPAVTGKYTLRAAWAGGWVGGWVEGVAGREKGFIHDTRLLLQKHCSYQYDAERDC